MGYGEIGLGRRHSTMTHFFTKEPIIHSQITDGLSDDHPLAYNSVHCDECKIEMLHASNNECMQTWIETEFGNYCVKCFKIVEVLETLEECLHDSSR